ncbi:hypothetical protein DRO34_07375, partial [Candidatus Bathyarchaeota archaeon]
MKFKFKLRKRELDAEDIEEEMLRAEEALIGYLDLKTWGTPEGYVEVESYPLKPPFSYASILRNEETAEYLYIVDELPLSNEEREGYFRMRNILEYELKAPEQDETLAESFRRQMPIIIAKHQKVLRGISSVGVRKILYYLERDIVGYGKIDPLRFDPYVEDISCSGVNKPIYLWHRRYENIRTNVIFRDEEELDDFVMKIVHKA